MCWLGRRVSVQAWGIFSAGGWMWGGVGGMTGLGHVPALDTALFFLGPTRVSAEQLCLLVCCCAHLAGM